MREKGLIVKPTRGTAHPFATLQVAELFAMLLVERGQGPVEVVSAYTGDVLTRFTGDAYNVQKVTT